MNGAQPPMCSMWVPAVPSPSPPPLPVPLTQLHSHTLSFSFNSSHTLLTTLLSSHTLSHNNHLNKVNPLSQHSLTGNVLYKFVLELCYLFIVLCYILGMFIFIIIFC